MGFGDTSHDIYMKKKERGSTTAGCTVCTLHSFCLRLLRQFYDGFTVYDDDDARNIVKGLLQEMVEKEDLTDYPVARVQEQISLIKRSISAFSSSTDEDGPNEEVGPDVGQTILQAEAEAESDGVDSESDTNCKNDKIVKMARLIYPLYEAALRQRNAFDFDGLIVHVLVLLQISSVNNSEVARNLAWEHFARHDVVGINEGRYDSYLYGISRQGGNDENGEGDEQGPLEEMVAQLWAFGDHARARFAHILVDEWQDCDKSQYNLVQALVKGPVSQAERAGKHKSKSMFKGLFLYFSIPVVSCFMWIGALDCSDLLQSYSVISLAYT